MLKPTPTSQQLLDTVANIVKWTLDDKFEGYDITFDSIFVQPRTDLDGDEILQMKIVYEGERKLLDPAWTVGLVDCIMPKLEAEGIFLAKMPVYSFIPTFEWEELQRLDPYDELD